MNNFTQTLPNTSHRSDMATIGLTQGSSILMKNFTQTLPNASRRSDTATIGLTQGSSALLSINIPQASLGLWVNATPKSETEGIVSSEFNLTTPGSVPLVIRVVPGEPSRVIAFVRRHAAPTTTDYDWLLTSWDNADNYTLYVAADLTKDVSQIYVGVQSSDGMSSITLLRKTL